MTERWEALEAALVCLRDPLARIQLAASQLTDATSPGDSQARCIQQAVGEIDLRIEDVLTGIRREGDAGAAQADVREVLLRAVRDLGPVLATRGMQLELLPLPDAPLWGNESLVRRTVCRLLLGASRWTHTRPSAVRIGLVAEGDRVGIRLDVQAQGPESNGGSRDILGPVRGFALGEGISLEHREDPGEGHGVVLAYFNGSLAS